MNLDKSDNSGAWWTIVVLVLWTVLLMVLMTIPMADNPFPHRGIFQYWDKFAHVFLFGVTGILSVYGGRFFRRFGPRLFFGLAFSLFLAFGTEFVQAFISYRTADIYDLMSDLLGIFIGLFIYLAAYLNDSLRTHLKL